MLLVFALMRDDKHWAKVIKLATIIVIIAVVRLLN